MSLANRGHTHWGRRLSPRCAHDHHDPDQAAKDDRSGPNNTPGLKFAALTAAQGLIPTPNHKPIICLCGNWSHVERRADPAGDAEHRHEAHQADCKAYPESAVKTGPTHRHGFGVAPLGGDEGSPPLGLALGDLP